MVHGLVGAVVFEGLGGFVRLDAGPSSGAARFRKEVLRVGTWRHPLTGQRLNFTRADLDDYAANTNRWLELGHRSYFPDGHTESARANLGQWSEFAREGNRLMATVEVPDADTAALIGKTINDVSCDIKFGLRSSSGEQFPGGVVFHVAATPQPVIPGQSNFVRLSYEAGGEDPENGEPMDPKAKTPAGADAKGQVPPMAATPVPSDAVVAAIRQELGLPPDADQGSIVDAIRQLCADEDEEGEDGDAGATSIAPESPAIAAMSLSFQKKLQALEESNRKTRRRSAEREVKLAMEAAVHDGGLPIDKDAADLALSLLSSEKEADEVAGRKILELSLAPTKLLKGIRSKEFKAPANDGADRKAKEAEAASERSKEEMLLSLGYTPEGARGSDGFYPQSAWRAPHEK
jgi:hypothetical protein